MRIVIVGLGIQGRKRLQAAGGDVIATVDPNVAEADYPTLADVQPESYDAALLCVPTDTKASLVSALVGIGKHVLVEKPLVVGGLDEIDRLAAAVRASGVVCYTAYNHRFEPHLIRLRDTIGSGVLGPIYRVRLFYGNGTARDVRDSAWRDKGAGIVGDLAPHLLDMLLFLFGEIPDDIAVWAANRFENAAPDHVVCGRRGTPLVEIEMSLVCWRNHFSADIYGEKGSAHVDSLCKWGPSTFTHRTRILPSGRPVEEPVVLEQPDSTWQAEYAHFKALCADGEASDLTNDRAIAATLIRLSAETLQVLT